MSSLLTMNPNSPFKPNISYTVAPAGGGGWKGSTPGFAKFNEKHVEKGTKWKFLF